MSEQPFVLQPFRDLGYSSNPGVDLKLTGGIDRATSHLTLHYQLSGNLDQLIIPEVSNCPQRQDHLWQTTCFEMFLGVAQTESYWEFNLSPAGHWNVYRFSTYRQEMQVELAFTDLPLAIQSRPQTLQLSLEVDYSDILSGDPPLEVAINAVVQAQTGELTYWALTHLGREPDFHRRDGFAISL